MWVCESYVNRVESPLRFLMFLKHHGIFKAQERSVWIDFSSEESLPFLVASTGPSVLSFECTVCHCQFRRSQDIARHNCATTQPRTGPS